MLYIFLILLIMIFFAIIFFKYLAVPLLITLLIVYFYNRIRLLKISEKQDARQNNSSYTTQNQKMNDVIDAEYQEVSADND